MGPATEQDRSHHSRRLAVALGAAVALLTPQAFGLVHSWRSAGDELVAVGSERHGVEYLRPLTQLAGTLTDAWVSAVAGDRTDPQAIRLAVMAVEPVDARYGEQLGVHPAWVDLQQRVLAAVAPNHAGPGAGEAAELVDSTVRFLGVVGTASSVALDPAPDRRYLADAAVTGLPQIVASSGQLAAQVLDPGTSGGTDPAVASGVAADRLSRAAVDLDASLRAGAPGSAAPADLAVGATAVRLAADEMAPSAPMLGPPTALPTGSRMADAQRRLQGAAIPLSAATLDQLDTALRARQSGLRRERVLVTLVAVAGMLAACALLWARLPAVGRAEPAAEELAPVVRGPAGDDEEQPEYARLLDARALLREVEVVRVGRAVRSVPGRTGAEE
jgi:hypothetical protein